MAGSYLGHGAKYWADRYFEQKTQTRLPDDSADLSWREKYLALEKECSHYQATLSEMRVEIEYLRHQQSTNITVDPELQRKVEKWQLGYTHLTAALKEKEKQCSALSAEKQRLDHTLHTVLNERVLYQGKTAEQWAELYFSEQLTAQKNQAALRDKNVELSTALADYHKFNEVDGHDAIYWHHEYKSLQDKSVSKKFSWFLNSSGRVSDAAFFLILLFVVSSMMLLSVFSGNAFPNRSSWHTSSSVSSVNVPTPEVTPKSGILTQHFSKRDERSPLMLTAPDDRSYYLCLCKNNRIISSYYIRPGEMFSVHVPVGSYSIYYAYSSATATWLGEQYLWGTHTVYYKFLDNFAFYADRGQNINFTRIDSYHVRPVLKTAWAELH